MAIYAFVKAPNRAGYGYILGYGDMVFSFFSTVSYHLEGLGNWGKRFPRLLLDLCDHGIVENEHLDELDEELKKILCELQNLPISDAIYDIGNLELPIPWELLPGAENHNLAQPWVTPRGALSYFFVFSEQIQRAKTEKSPLLLIYPYETADKKAFYCRKEKGREYWTKEKSK